MTPLPLAIVLGVDTPIGLTVVRELGRHGVPVHAVGRRGLALGRASRWAQSFSVRPKGKSLGDYLPALIEETGATALLAISESDLLELAALPLTIAACRILTPRMDQLEVVLDKQRTYEFAHSCGISVPQSWQPSESENFASKAASLAYPLVLKWPDPPAIWAQLDDAGLAFVKAEIILDKVQLLSALERYVPLKCWPLAQHYAPGYGFGQMLNMQDGEATLSFQHRRIHEWPPEGGVSTLCAAVSTKDHKPQMERSVQLLRALGWQGPAMVEYRYDPATGSYALMEINGRFWGSLPLASACGAEFAWEVYRREILGQTSEMLPVRDDLLARYMIPETRRMLRLMFARKAITDPMFHATPFADLWRYIGGFLNPKVRSYVFAWSDPMPFCYDLWAMLLKFARLGSRS